MSFQLPEPTLESSEFFLVGVGAGGEKRGTVGGGGGGCPLSAARDLPLRLRAPRCHLPPQLQPSYSWSCGAGFHLLGGMSEPLRLEASMDGSVCLPLRVRSGSLLGEEREGSARGTWFVPPHLHQVCRCTPLEALTNCRAENELGIKLRQNISAAARSPASSTRSCGRVSSRQESDSRSEGGAASPIPATARRADRGGAATRPTPGEEDADESHGGAEAAAARSGTNPIDAGRGGCGPIQARIRSTRVEAAAAAARSRGCTSNRHGEEELLCYGSAPMRPPPSGAKIGPPGAAAAENDESLENDENLEAAAAALFMDDYSVRCSC